MLPGTCHCGQIGWTFDGMPTSVTACNCTLCRRYGVLWIYDFEGERIRLTGPSATYRRVDEPIPALESISVADAAVSPVGAVCQLVPMAVAASLSTSG